MEAIGVYVRALRTESGLTQEALAREVSLSEKSIRNLENGTHEPKVTKLGEIIKLLRGSAVHVAQLMDPAASINQALELADEIIKQTGFTDDQRRYLEGLTPSQKQALLTVAREMQQ